jgi:hypothetical protein
MHIHAFCVALFLLQRPHECWQTESHSVQNRPTTFFLSNSNNDQEPLPSCLSKNNAEEIKTLQKQADALRAEAESMRLAVVAAKGAKRKKELANIDRWLDHLLVNVTLDENTQMLNTVDQVARILQEERFSQEQVDKMFQRICDTTALTGRLQSRSNCSPLMSLLVDAAGKLDCVEREDNPNKRWSGRVERRLRIKLFAMDWGIKLEDDTDPGPGRFL